MSTHRLFPLLMFLSIGGLFRTASGELSVTPPDWHCVSSGTEIDMPFPCNHPVDNATWTLKINGRTARQQSATIVDGVAHAVLQLPDLANGAAELDAALEVQLDSQQHGMVQAVHRLFVYPKSILESRTTQLKAANLALYDPDGRTRETFQAAGIPVHICRNLAACESVERGILIVGEGLDWSRHRGLAETCVKLSQNGVSVLCLAPQSATFPVAARVPNSSDSPSAIDFRDIQVLRRLDKRFDTQKWNGKDSLLSTLNLAAYRNAVTIQAETGGSGWAWCQVRVPGNDPQIGPKDSTTEKTKGGTSHEPGSEPNFDFKPTSDSIPVFTCCGFGIIERWNDGPMAQLLFMRLIDSISSSPSNL